MRILILNNGFDPCIYMVREDLRMYMATELKLRYTGMHAIETCMHAMYVRDKKLSAYISSDLDRAYIYREILTAERQLWLLRSALISPY